MGHTPSTAGTFRKKFRKNSGKTPETLSERFLEFPSRVRLGCPKPYNSTHLRLPERFQPCPSFPCFFGKGQGKPPKKTRIFYSYQTPKIPGKEEENGQKNKEILAGEKNKEIQKNKERKDRENSLPPSTAGDASFFRIGSGEGLSELVMEFPAVLGVLLILKNNKTAGNNFDSNGISEHWSTQGGGIWGYRKSMLHCAAQGEAKGIPYKPIPPKFF